MHGRNSPITAWEKTKYRLSLTGVFLSVVLLFVMLFEGAVINFHCSLTEFLTFECNRWAVVFNTLSPTP